MSSDNLPRLGSESVDSFNCAHGEGFFLPLWMAVGEMEFGKVVYFYSHSNKGIRKVFFAICVLKKQRGCAAYSNIMHSMKFSVKTGLPPRLTVRARDALFRASS